MIVVMRERGLRDENAHALLLAERRDAADMIAGNALGFVRGGSIAASFAPAAAASFFRLTSLVGGHQHADDRIAGLRHQGFQQPRRRHAERLRRLHADALGIRIVVVFVQLECDARFGECDGRGRTLRHRQ